MYGYGRAPVTMPAVSAIPVVRSVEAILGERIREVMAGAGYSEVITYSFVSPVSVDCLGLSENDERRRFVGIKNPSRKISP